MRALERYRRVLRAPHVSGLWAATTLARLPIGINGLAIILAIRAQTGSFAAAGIAAGAHALTFGISSPAQGRYLDRHGPRRVLPPLIALHAVATLTFVALLGHTSAAVLVVLAALSGAGLPPWSSILRAMWPRLLGDAGLMATAFALDAAIVELVFIAGPLLVAVAVAIAGPSEALLASVALVVAGTALLVGSPAIRTWEPERHGGRGLFGALASPGLLTVFLATIPCGFAFGAMEIALPAFAVDHGAAGQAGLLIAVWSLGSALGAFVYGARLWPGPLAGLWLACTALLGVALLLPLTATSTALLIALLVPTGAFIAPSIAAGSQLMGMLAPPGMTTEAYAWGPTAIVVGAAAGSAVAGAVVEASGWRAAVAIGGATALAGAAIGLARRRTLVGP